MTTEQTEWSIRVTVLTRPGTSRAQAERAAKSIQAHAEKLACIDHAYERDVYDLGLDGDE